MSVTFTKLFASITESTVWCESDSTRLAWITMLAMADSRGRVWASVPGLANRARISVDAARDTIATFLAPDPDSRTPDHDGRRIEPIDGGWRLLNHEKYRSIRDEESIKESKRRYINARREKERAESKVVENVDRSRDNAEAEAEADKSNTKSKSSALATRLPLDWTPSPDDLAFCAKERTDLAPNDVADRFRDYWVAVPGAKGRKVDWVATWRNWVRNERGNSHGKNGSSRADRLQRVADELTGRDRSHAPVINGTATRVG